MIVISSTLALALQQQRYSDWPVIGWQNLVTIDNIAATSEHSNYPATNLANPSTTSLQGWRSDSASEQYLTVTLSTAEEVDYLAVARHNWGSAEIGVTVEGIAGEEEADWEELIGERFLGNDEPAIFRFGPGHYAGLRFKLAPDAAAPRAAVLYSGKLLEVLGGVQPGHIPINYGRDRNVVTGRSQAGDFLGRIIVGGTRRSSVNFTMLDPAWYREEFEPFADASAASPFFWGWHPTTYPHEVGFAWLTADPRPVQAHQAGQVDVQLEFEAII